MTILVTGATGNVGREVVRALQAARLSFVAGDRDVDRGRKALGPDVAVRPLDFTRPETYPAAVEGMKALFLLRPPPIADVDKTLNVLVDEAIRAGVEHVVFLSVVGADRQSWVPHHRVERHLERSRVAWTFLRPGFFAQNCQDAYRRDIAEDDRLYVPAGRGRVSFVDVRDVAEVAVRAFQDPSLRSQALELTGPEAITFQETAALLGEVLGRPIRYVPASIPGYLLHLLRRRGMGLGQAAVQTVLHVGLRFGNGAAVTETIPRVLGRPARTMATYLQDKRATW